MKKTSVPLVIAFTPDYFIPAATCLYSIITSMQAEGELHVICLLSEELPERLKLTYIIHSGFISGYQNRYGDNLKPPTNVYHRMTA